MGQYLRIWVLKTTEYFTGYVNPLLAYGEDKAIQDAAEAGANGFIMVDLPPEEAITFREKCRRAKCVLIPLFKNARPSFCRPLQPILCSLDCPLDQYFTYQISSIYRRHIHLCRLKGKSSDLLTNF